MSPPKIFIAESWLNSLTRGTVCIEDHFRMACNVESETHPEIIREHVFMKSANLRGGNRFLRMKKTRSCPTALGFLLPLSLPCLPPTAATHMEKNVKREYSMAETERVSRACRRAGGEGRAAAIHRC